MDKRPYSVKAFECLIAKVRRETPLRRMVVEPLILHIKYSIEWLNYDIYPITVLEFLSDQRRLTELLKELIRMYKERDPEGYKMFVNNRSELIKYE